MVHVRSWPNTTIEVVLNDQIRCNHAWRSVQMSLGYALDFLPNIAYVDVFLLQKMKEIAQGIQIMEAVGLCTSFVCLAISIFIFCYFRWVSGTCQNFDRCQLFISGHLNSHLFTRHVYLRIISALPRVQVFPLILCFEEDVIIHVIYHS